MYSVRTGTIFTSLCDIGTLSVTRHRDRAPLSVCASHSRRRASGSGCGHFLPELRKLRTGYRVSFALNFNLACEGSAAAVHLRSTMYITPISCAAQKMAVRPPIPTYMHIITELFASI